METIERIIVSYEIINNLQLLYNTFAKGQSNRSRTKKTVIGNNQGRSQPFFPLKPGLHEM